jgi:cystathionine beta-lyase
MEKNGLGIDFDTVIDRRHSASVKWDLYQGRDIIPLWVADMDFRSPPAVIEALHERADHGIFGYASVPPELTDAVLAMLEEEYGWQADAEWLVWLPGLVTGLNVACRAGTGEGDDILTFVPVYPPFMSAPRNSRRGLIKVPLCEEEGSWELDVEALNAAISEKTRLLLLCNPHNPVGRVWNRDELSILAETAERHDLIICSDEIHAGLVLDEDKRHTPIATLSPEVAARTITLNSPSKTYNIPGLGCSFAIIADRTLRMAFHQAMAGIVPHVNILGFTAALAAYRHGEEWRQELLHYLRGNRDLLEKTIGAIPELSMAHVEATYLAWIDTRLLKIEQPARFFEKAGVGLSDGADFGAPGFVRLNFGCPRLLLREALARMREALHHNSSIKRS